MNKVLLVGGSGFIGTALAEFLNKEGFECTRTAKRPYEKGIIAFDSAKTGSLRNILETGQYAYIVNLIGKTSEGETRGLSRGEREGLFAQFEACKDLLTQISKIVHVGSCAEYGSAPRPYKESGPTWPVSQYGIGKLQETEFFQNLSFSGVNTLVLRPSIVFGPGQRPGMFIPDAILALRGGARFHVKNPDHIRDFLYVKDFASAVKTVLLSDTRSGEVYNVGSGSGIKVKAMISEIEFALGDAYGAFEHPLVATEHDELTEEVEIGKITRDFKWSPRVSLKDAIRETVGKVGK